MPGPPPWELRGRAILLNSHRPAQAEKSRQPTAHYTFLTIPLPDPLWRAHAISVNSSCFSNPSRGTHENCAQSLTSSLRCEFTRGSSKFLKKSACRVRKQPRALVHARNSPIKPQTLARVSHRSDFLRGSGPHFEQRVVLAGALRPTPSYGKFRPIPVAFFPRNRKHFPRNQSRPGTQRNALRASDPEGAQSFHFAVSFRGERIVNR